jgi:hypothetical protein
MLHGHPVTTFMTPDQPIILGINTIGWGFWHPEYFVLVTEQAPLPFTLIAAMCILTALETMELLFGPVTIAIDYIVVICRRTMFKHKACYIIPAFAPRNLSPNLSPVRI